MDKKDEEELKEWKEKNLNYVETYGIDIFNEKENSKKVTQTIEIINKIIKVILIIFAIGVVVFTFALLIYRWKIVYDKVHINPKKTIESMYHIKIKEISKDVNEYDNGKYIFALKDNTEIQFNAYVEWTSMVEDYTDNCQKYYFEHWQNENKLQIKTEETYTNNILKYEQYIEINNKEEIENAVKLMYDFVMYVGDKFLPHWSLYLKIDENRRIYPFDYYNIDLENSINKSKDEYEDYTKYDI